MMKSHTNFKSPAQRADINLHTPGAGNFTSQEPFAVRETRICVLLGFFHTMLLGLSVCVLLSSFCNLAGTDYMVSLVLFALCVLSMDILAWILAHNVHHLLLYFFGGLLFTAILAAAARCLAARFWGIPNAFSLGVCITCLIILSIHASACTKSGEVLSDYISTHDSDVPFRMAHREIPTILTAPGLRCMGFFAIFYAIGLIGRRPLIWRSEFYLALLDLFVCAAYRCIHRFTVFLLDNHTSANLPVRTIRRVHGMLLAIGALLFALALTPAVLYGREPLSELRFTISGDPTEEQAAAAELSPSAGSPDFSFLEDLSDGTYVYTPPEWLTNLMHILLILLLFALVICVFFGILHTIRYAMKLFAVCDEDEVLFLWDETADSAVTANTKPLQEDGFFSINRKIRRLYKKTIRKATSGIPDQSATPTELEAHAGLLGSDEMAILHEVYEKARYSKTGASREDADQLIPGGFK